MRSSSTWLVILINSSAFLNGKALLVSCYSKFKPDVSQPGQRYRINEGKLVKNKNFFAIVGIILLASLILLTNKKELPVSSPEAAGLIWQECLLAEGYGNWRQAQECFGLPEPTGEREDGINDSK
jgi:hypothetical protein